MVALCVFWDCVSGAAGKGSALPTGKGKLANEDDGKKKTSERRGREKEKQRTKTKNAVGNGAVEFYSRNIGKLDKNRADVTGGLSKRTRQGKLANEEDGKGNEEDGKRNEKKRRGNGKERREREKEKEKRRKRKREEDSKKESGTRPGTPVSSLMQVQKENSPKTVPTRPAALRRGAEEEKRKENEARRALEKEKRDRKRKATTETRKRSREPGTAAGNAGVKFDAGSKGKLAKNRPDETRGPPKRRRKGKKKEQKARRRLGKQKRNRKRNATTETRNRSRERRCQV